MKKKEERRIWVIGEGVIGVTDYNSIYICEYNDGLYAYRFNGSSFNEIAHLNVQALHVDYSDDGTIFIANDNGIKAYLFQNTNFLVTASFDLKWGAIKIIAGFNNLVYTTTEDEVKVFAYS